MAFRLEQEAQPRCDTSYPTLGLAQKQTGYSLATGLDKILE